MKKKAYLAVMPVIAVVLEILPYGAVLNFGRPPEEGGSFRQTFSYFSLTPYGYGNFGPFIAAVLTCLILILALCNVFGKENQKTGRVIGIVSLLAFLASLSPIFFGISCFSALGAVISALLAAEACLAFLKR